MSRTTRCATCAQPFDVETDTGPLPSKCDPCDPEAAARREENRERSRQSAARRANELRDLRLHAAALEQQLRAGRPARLRPSVPAERSTVAIAVRRVGTAEGARQTAERLRELAAEALAWADALAVSRETEPPSDLDHPTERAA